MFARSELHLPDLTQDDFNIALKNVIAGSAKVYARGGRVRFAPRPIMSGNEKEPSAHAWALSSCIGGVATLGYRVTQTPPRQ